MISVAFCIPGDLELPTGGYRYDREVLKRLPAHGVAAEHLPLGDGFPHPDDADVERALSAMAGVDRRTVLLIDGLALGALPPDGVAALPHRKVALVHHPLGLESGMEASRAATLLRNEAEVLRHMAQVIVTSDATKRILINDFNVSPRVVSVAEPGTERRARAAGTGNPVHVMAVGAVSPRKAYPQLVEALQGVRANWRLTIVGALTLSPSATAELRSVIARLGVHDRVTLAGALDDGALAACYASADIFAAASLFEGYGMALAEALAHGLPIVTSSGGAAAETVPDAAALKAPPGDTAALAGALERLVTDAALRRRMADAAWAAAALLPSWDDTAATIAEVVKSM